MSDWQIVPISELCEFIVDCLHETPEIVDYKTGYLMVRTSDVRNGYVNLESARNVTQDVYLRRIQRGVPQIGDIIISREAPLGEVGRLKVDNMVCLGQRLIHYKPNAERVNPRYLLYALLSPSVQTEFHANKGVGSVVDNLRMSVARSLPIPLAPRDHQDFVADMLGSLDDKIELNRRTNDTLEATARALFKSWFVDFDPVHSKSRGVQPPGMDTETAALFPDSFEDSELGLIPTGWRVGQIADLGKVITGKTPPSDRTEFFNGEIPFIRIPDMHNQVFIVSTEKTLTREGADFQYKKLLPELSVCVSCIATPGLVVLTARPSHTNQQINSIVCHQEISPYFTLFAVRDLAEEIINRGSGGSATLNLNKSEFEKIPLLMPNSSLIRYFHQEVMHIFDMILLIEHQSRTLAETRDALLPKLVSGELRVGDL